ncbi:MAG: hypothetical protein OXC48_07920 [Endozoicomonadaceae bacterium]|nr:hypothetical protein [Endozoicomonadaceae bacterium]
MNKLSSFLIVFLPLIIISAPAANAGLIKDKEAWVQEIWCKAQQGTLEYKLKSGESVDCLTPKYAIEIDRAIEWHEAVGQSLYYAKKTGKNAGIVLVLRSKNDHKYLEILNTLVDYYKLPITVWHISPSD